jgi:hypothetical protein
MQQSHIRRPRLQPLSTPPQEPITDLEVDNEPGRYSASALLFLVEHNAQVFERENTLCVIFPGGTTIQDLPRGIAIRRRITFPDGAACIYIQDDTLPEGHRRFLLIPQPGKEDAGRHG